MKNGLLLVLLSVLVVYAVITYNKDCKERLIGSITPTQDTPKQDSTKNLSNDFYDKYGKLVPYTDFDNNKS